MNSIYTETIQLQAKRDWFYQFAEKVESDRLFYSINYNLEDESKMIYAELIGDGSSKLIHINLNNTQNNI